MNKLFDNKLPTTDYALLALIKKLKVNVSKTSCIECVQKHPNYPSLLAISDCLNDWGVKNQTYQLDKETYKEDLLFPFLAHFPENGGRFVLVMAIHGDEISYCDERTKRGTFTEEVFLNQWNGIALHAEPTIRSGEISYTQNRIKEALDALILPMSVVCLGIIFYLFLNAQPINWTTLTLSIIKLAGIGISVLLLMESLNVNNPLIKNLCSLGGKNDCNAILKSDAAKITPWLSWSEVGFFYFTGSFLALLVSPAALPVLAWLNLLALPYTIYSISYQYKNKNWCILCCTVQTLLVLEAATLFASQENQYLALHTTVNSILILIASFLVPVLFWAFLKPFFSKAHQVKPLQQQLKKFKYNTDLFKQALKNQPKYAIDDEIMPVRIGNPDAEIIITMVSNPFCGPCAKAHKTIDEWLQYRDDIQLNVIFTTANTENDPRTKVSRHLSALSKNENKLEVKDAMNAWYNTSNKNYEEWALKFPVLLDDEIAIVTEKQKTWCDLAEIKFTPTILINGYKLPEPYLLEDLKYLLD